MKFKVRITGENPRMRVDMVVICDDYEEVVRLKKYAKRNKFQCNVELVDYV